MTHISKAQPVATLINVFTVAPENQQKLVDILIEATENVMRHLPGFVSANIHKSFDGTRVTNYAQWRSPEDFDAMFNDPEVTVHMNKVREIATNDGRLYEVVHIDRIPVIT
ncbi:MAG: antibiotic biosynthesis monooxygenase [Chloroflexi bacterium]|nr:antibiotic biosynthesis monooxygenase [Chloroflexota bacterium]